MTTISRAAVVDACTLLRHLARVPGTRSIGFPASRRRCSTAATSCCRPRTASPTSTTGAPLTDAPPVPDRIALEDVHGDGGDAARRARSRSGSTTPSGSACPSSPNRPSRRSPCASCSPTVAGWSATDGTATSGSCSARSPIATELLADRVGRLGRARPQRAVQVLERRVLAPRTRHRAGERAELRRLRRPSTSSIGSASRTPAPSTTRLAPADYAGGHSALSYAERTDPARSHRHGSDGCGDRLLLDRSDVVRYASAHFAGDDRLVDDDSKRLLQRTEWAVTGTDTSYGLGFAVSKIGDRRVLGHGGGYPGHITRTFFDPVDRFAVSVLTNAIDGPALTYASAAVRLIDLAAGERPAEADDVGRRSHDRDRTRRGSAGGSRRCGGSTTSSRSAAGCIRSTPPVPTLPSRPDASRSSTTPHCASSTPRDTRPPAND